MKNGEDLQIDAKPDRSCAVDAKKNGKTSHYYTRDSPDARTALGKFKPDHSAAKARRSSGSSNRPQTSTKASARSAIIASSWCGEGVIRSRSVPFATVG